jgi:predicted LPLAT superfamily acyltransferase
VRRERGSVWLLRLMVWISLRLGRAVGRSLLYPIAGYFLLMSAGTRRAQRAYLARVLCRPPSWRDCFRQILTFAATLHDRIYFLNGRYDLFDVTVVGEELMGEAVAQGQGAFLLGAHLGSFEVMRALGGQHEPGLKVLMATYLDNARKFNAMLAAINPGAQQDIIALGGLDSMLLLREKLEQGMMIGMMGDRSLGPDTMASLPFLGEAAPFPLGPFRLAALLRRKVIFMTGLYCGGSRYQVRFELLADFSNCARAERETEIHAAMLRYAGLLESCCREAPYNWFNFYDFWLAGTPPS